MPALNPHPSDTAAGSVHDDVMRAAAGDVTAFERIYRAHIARVHSLARRMRSRSVLFDVRSERHSRSGRA